MKHESVSVEVQFAMTEVAADAAADVARRRSTVVGAEAHPLQIGSKAQTLIPGCLRADIQQDIAQAALDLQALDHRHDLVRQRCQRLDQRRERGQVEAIGLDFPGFFTLLTGSALIQLQVRFPTGLAQAHGQRIELHIKTLLAALEPAIKREVFHLGLFTTGISPT
ncbi:hypothetical protein D9M71_605190 [compost metagenome]